MVAEKQAIAVQAWKIMDEVAEMGGKMKKQILYQHPNSLNQFPTPIPVIVNTGTSPMEIDTIQMKTNKRNPFPAIRSLCTVFKTIRFFVADLPVIQRPTWWTVKEDVQIRMHL